MISSFKKITKTPMRKRGLMALAALALAFTAGFAMFHTVQADEADLPVDAQPLNVPSNSSQAMDMGNAAPTSTEPEAPADAPVVKPILRILFDNGDATLSDDERAEIADFVENFKVKGGRVTLKGYAGLPGSQSSNDRRLSLRRVLAVRQAILAGGINAERLEVRALGGANDAGPQDRVDILKPGR